jgi:hypothetical protein
MGDRHSDRGNRIQVGPLDSPPSAEARAGIQGWELAVANSLGWIAVVPCRRQPQAGRAIGLGGRRVPERQMPLRPAMNPKTGRCVFRVCLHSFVTRRGSFVLSVYIAHWRSKRFNTGDPPRHLFFVIFCAVAAAMPVIVPVGRAILPNAT